MSNHQRSGEVAVKCDCDYGCAKCDSGMAVEPGPATVADTTKDLRIHTKVDLPPFDVSDCDCDYYDGNCAKCVACYGPAIAPFVAWPITR